jgi:hypothetical protein
MTRRLLLLLPALLFAGATVAEAVKVRTSHDAKVDFSKFDTFRWKTPEGPGGQELDGPLRAAAEKELAERGLRRAKNDEEADLVLQYLVGYADVLVAGFTVTAGWWGDLVAVPGGDSNVSAGLMLTLSLPEGGEPIWGGILVAKGTTENALMVMRDRAPKYARKILENYPPR